MGRDNLKEMGKTVLLVGLYLVFATRYFPGDLRQTLWATGKHLAGYSFFLGGAAYLSGLFFARRTGVLPPWPLLLRFYLSFGIMIEFFLGIAAYVARGS